MARHVKSFCGCCEFKIGCIIVAVCRIVITICATIVLFVIYFKNDLKQEVLQKEYFSENELIFYTIFSIPVCILITRASYFFIRGARSNNNPDIDGMMQYFYCHLAIIVVLLVSFTKTSFSLAILEFYLMCCSVLLIEERKELLGENSLNVAETPPPQYDSCVNNIEPQTSVMQTDEEIPSLNAWVEVGTNSHTNAGMEPEDNPIEDENEFENSELSEESSSKNTAKKPDEISIQNTSQVNSIENARMEHEKKNIKNSGVESEQNCFKNERMELDQNSAKIFTMDPTESP